MKRTRAICAAACILVTLTSSVPAEQQVIYPPSAMPRVDMHTHMDATNQYAKAIEAMDQWGGTISISLAGLFWVNDNNGSNASPASVRQIPGNDMVYAREKLNDRILFVPGAFTIPSAGIWWGVDEIKKFKEQGFVGLKLWPHGAILSSKIPLIHEQLEEAGRQGMPLVGYHVGDPGNNNSNNAAFPKFEEDAINVVKRHPQTTIIFAHGLFMLANDQGMEQLGRIFDEYPNVFVDLAFTHNSRQPAHYTVSKAREFYIKYRDRILFGSDVFAAGGGASGFLNERQLLETGNVTSGLHGGPQMEGFNLPDEVLNHIYYWNAARLIPRVRQVLEARQFKMGYELGRFTFDRLPPDVTVNPLAINGQAADLTGTLGSVTESLVVEVGGKMYVGTDNRNGTWRLPGDKIAGLPVGTYDVKVMARNSIGLIRTDSTTNELTVVASPPAEKADFWVRNDAGRITHDCTGKEPLVMCMQGRKVVMEVHADPAQGVSYKARFFHVLPDMPEKLRVVFEANSQSMPMIQVDGQPLKNELPLSATFDGLLTLAYPETNGVITKRTVYPSMGKALVLEEWQVRNAGSKPVTMSVMPSRKEVMKDKIMVIWDCRGIASAALVEPGGVCLFFTSVQAVPTAELKVDFDVATERDARRALATAAWRGPGRLETPEPQLDAAFALQKLHVLECPMETDKGLITHNGSLTYSPGIWANDPVEYSSPLFPFFGDAELNRASMNMYRVWQDHCQKHGTVPFPGSFEGPTLQLVQRERGDDAMVLYGLSKFLLFQGDRAAAAEMWPLIMFSADTVLKHATAEGIVASETDEMEGRYPTGKANLSTSSLAYGGYRLAARLAHALGKPEEKIFDQRADALRIGLEKYFGADIEGFKTYRYFKENTTLRGWILLPLAMGIHDRQEGTVAALLSDKLWPNRMAGADILAETGRETEWGRETYYALRALFKAGHTEEAIDLTRRVVKAQVFGSRGPYPDEDAIDMLCPGSLYPRVFTEGMFGIVPTGLDSFECTPWLPKAWPRMALRDVRAFGRAWDLVVERVGAPQKVTVSSGGRTMMTGTGTAGKTYTVTFPKQSNK
jgi:predicted TIM-barrel fold metal-dependent hydrolase